MRITYRGDYALRAVLNLAMHYNQGAVTIHELAKRADAPAKFLEQVLLDLKKGGFVESKRGTNGGYLLSRHPKNIKMGEVVRFIDGPIEPIACVLRNVCKEVAVDTSNIVDKVTFEDLAFKAKTGKKETVYSI